MRKILILLLFIAEMVSCFTGRIYAVELPEEYRYFYESIPNDVSEMLPDGIFSDDAGEVAESLTDALSPRSLLGLVREMLVGGLPSAFSLFCALVCLMLISVLMNTLADSFAGAGLKMDIAWGIADISQCVLAFINIPVCIIIGSVSYKALADYVSQRRQGVEPEYNAQRCGVAEKTDFWK